MPYASEHGSLTMHRRTRREFLVAAVGTGAGLLAVACGGASTSAPAATSSTTGGALAAATGPATKGNVSLTMAVWGTQAESDAYTAAIGSLQGAEPQRLGGPYLDPNYGQAFTPLYWSAASYGGKPFLLPHHADTLAVIYNKNFMQKLGVEPPKTLDKAWTWQEFDTVARRLKGEAGAQYGLGVAWQGGNGQRWLYFLYQHGGQLLTEDLKSPAVNSPAGREAIAWCQKWFQDGIIPPNNSVKSPDPLQNLFAQGTVGMMVNGHWQIPFVNDQMKNYSWDVTFMPQDAARATEFGGTGLAISKDSKNPEVAADFMKFMVNDENMLSFSLAAQHLPLAGPVIAVLTIFTFMWRWNDFALPLVVLTDQRMYTIQLGLNLLKDPYNVEWTNVMAIALISLLPMLAIFVLFQRQFVQGIASTGLK